ncbi:hypothetical protein DACRYDRAFT_91896 [Dacryopinax primogenitus]|uniref:Uncharacterized protein n=1 Tax=Dacryopinax primogenitus (strain DJM 731) TaxID=1858805 RepID=M5FN73_DACPD|nr:uncharacterized protein DACRYDRAFT_91896 [Dacryopinax primogenitus]EJT96945.1 hypothetical protein DACRYDRAFT_91896 [Dacryopinax primogenitus]
MYALAPAPSSAALTPSSEHRGAIHHLPHADHAHPTGSPTELALPNLYPSYYLYGSAGLMTILRCVDRLGCYTDFLATVAIHQHRFVYIGSPVFLRLAHVLHAMSSHTTSTIRMR